MHEYSKYSLCMNMQTVLSTSMSVYEAYMMWDGGRDEKWWWAADQELDAKD